MRCQLSEVSRVLKWTIPKHLTLDDIHFVCIGTDRSTGDSLGPLVGSELESIGYNNVTGTLHDPCHADNLDVKLSKIPDGKVLIGIDAALGQLSSVGMLLIGEGPIRPGAGVNKELTPVGKYSISGVVNVAGFMEYFVLQNTRLSLVMDMAKAIVAGIERAFPIRQQLEVAATIEGEYA